MYGGVFQEEVWVQLVWVVYGRERESKRPLHQIPDKENKVAPFLGNISAIKGAKMSFC